MLFCWVRESQLLLADFCLESDALFFVLIVTPRHGELHDVLLLQDRPSSSVAMSVTGRHREDSVPEKTTYQ